MSENRLEEIVEKENTTMVNGNKVFGGKKWIFWDWNGTLLNDTAASLEAINRMLAARGMKLLTEEHYREIFRFPVQDFYIDMGFNFSEESFEDLSVEFVANYRELQHGAALHTHSSDLLHAFRQRGFTQVILSAMERNTLLSDVRERGIEDFFTDILGPGDHYAKGKAGVAKEYLHTRKIPPDQIVILGDTFHDFEVSSDLGCDCILIAQGHHAESKLRTTGSHVQKNLAGVLNLLINP